MLTKFLPLLMHAVVDGGAGAGAAAGEGAPGEGAPGEGAPGEGAPGEGAPGESAPGESAPGVAGDGAAAASAAAAAAAAAAQEAVTYEFTLDEKAVFPETMTEDLTAFASKHGLPAEAAKDLSELVNKTSLSWPEKHLTEVANLKAEWTTKAREDSEYGGENFDANLALANKAVDQFGDTELKELLKNSGLSNHPAMIRAMWKVGQIISEDSVAAAIAGSAAQEKSAAALLYPNNP